MTKREMKALFEKAAAAGEIAATTIVPQAMTVMTVVGPRQSWHVPEGACGFAWVTIRPGTSSAARYAKKHLRARAGYYGGMEIWISAYGQSVTRKEAYAEAFAAVLREAGIAASAGSRLD